MTSDWPLDQFERGDIAVRVPPGSWSDAEEFLSELDEDWPEPERLDRDPLAEAREVRLALLGERAHALLGLLGLDEQPEAREGELADARQVLGVGVERLLEEAQRRSATARASRRPSAAPLASARRPARRG